MHSLMPKKPPSKYTTERRTRKHTNPKDDMQELRRLKEERIKFIDRQLTTTGCIGYKTIVAEYSVKQYTAYSDMRRYEVMNPGSTVRDDTTHQRVVTATFTPLFTDEVQDND